ncbi:phosphopantetheine-binding protein [Gynuella sunshinyii]|uniref:Acyl-CoA synthetase (AMP-forming)/AMP-acid ligase II n=1 Tax=Gynuella sunshinyii YC6258 TaxID=1445510 RepID=A0A0C5VF78_9GAMM|nr:phosphopantetheine-binding protein [Gynuella sunshinyii]AJQ92806.1 acyl-CoA synthetase (AMP-forming)/AMP-acid ligase II [Gynuella sunshinyii YC6258]
MNFSADREILGIVSRSSISYVKGVFSAFSKGSVVVNLRDENDRERCDMLGISQILTPEDDTGWVSDLNYPNMQERSQDIAQVLFTSGTEGKPKAILLSYGALANTTERLTSIMAIDSSIREYIGVPVNYSFGFGRCRVVSQAGGKFYIPPNGFNPSEIAEMLQRDKINAISAVPTLWRILLQSQELFLGIGEKVLWIEIGSQYMSRAEKEQLKALFPKARIIQHYGLTEASRSSFLKIHETEGEELESVGKAYDGVEVAVGGNGQIRIRGPHLASGQIKDTLEQRLVDDDGWFTTSDQGRIENGYIYYEGRADDLINCGGVKLFPEALEQDILTELQARRGIAISKIPDSLRGEQPLVSYLSDTNIDVEQLREVSNRVMLKHGFNAGKTLKIMPCKSFPMTDTGKIQRKKLSEQYQSNESLSTKSANTEAKQASPDSIADKLVDIWENVLKISPISLNDSFFDLGGDSLSAITVTMKMEKAGIPKDICRKIFEGLTIAQICQHFKSTQSPLLANKISQLIAIWEDVLKIHPISMNDSFFDLGGDSLSAISVTMRMEKAGIPKEVCRKIFEGLSIAQIVSNMDQSSDASNALTEKTKQLVQIWEETLKINPISIHDSFFELGGDSLSAITVTMKMEKAGIPKDICRRIFEGHSINDIVRSSDEPAAASTIALRSEQEPNTPSRKIPLAAGSQALNMVRGLLVLLNVTAHWMPGIIDRLPAVFAHFNKYLAPLYSSGTPGFAMVFGAGIGFFFFPRYQKNPQSVTPVAFRNAILLGSGITVYAALKIISNLAEGADIDGLVVSNAFWSVLTYYFFAVLSLPIWLRALTWKLNFSYSCLIAALLFYTTHLVIDAIQISPSNNPLIQPFILLLTAKYNYFEMSAGVMLGAAVGNWIRNTIVREGSLKLFGMAGLLLIGLAVILSYEQGQFSFWFIWPKGMFLWTWPFYLGVVIIGITGVYRYATSQHTHGWFDTFIKVLVVVGVLAFPIFIAHELVMPLKDLLTAMRVPGAFPLTIILFFTAVAYMVKRLYQVQFGSIS